MSSEAVWFGLTTDEDVKAAKAAKAAKANLERPQGERRSISDTTFETMLKRAGLDARQDELEEMALASGFSEVFPHLLQQERSRKGMRVSGKETTFGAEVNGSIVQVMSQMNKTASLATEIKDRADVTYEPLGPAQLATLRVANMEYDRYLDTDPKFLEVATSFPADMKAAGLNQITKKEESDPAPGGVGVIHCQRGPGTGTGEGSQNEFAFEVQRIMRHLMGTFLPKGADLVALYEELGMDTSDDVNWSEGTCVPGMKAQAPPARPHQHMGKQTTDMPV